MVSESPDTPTDPAKPASGHHVIRRLDLAGWSRLVDRLVAGACHELNGRSSALYGLAELSRGGDDNEFVSEALGKEALRLQELVKALRTISARGMLDPQPISLKERLEDLLTLFRALPGAEMLQIEARIDPGAPAILVPWAPLARGLLLLLSHMGSRALANGGRGSLNILFHRRPEGPVLEIETILGESMGSPDPAAEELIADSRTWPEEAERALEMIGCFFLERPGDDLENKETGASPRIVVRLPPLS